MCHSPTLLHIVQFLLLLCHSPTMAYYISPNDFGWAQSRSFCQKICQNELASVINVAQQSDMQQTIISRSNPYWNLDQNPWIGLFKLPDGNEWKWTDDANPSTLFSYPWAANQAYTATSSSQQCTTINSNSFLFHIESCDSISRPTICNHCNGVLNKYALVSTSDECATIYNTHPAIIIDAGVSSFDQSNAFKVYDLYANNAWIGLTVADISNLSTYQWADGTPYESSKYDPTTCVGTCSPWIDNGPDGNGECVQVTSNGWNTAPCTDVAYTLCNLPSELHTDLNDWFVVDGDFEFANGSVHAMGIPDGADNFAVMPQTQWFNGENGDIFIEYRFRVAFGDEEYKYAGIAIFNSLDLDVSLECGYSYHVGIVKYRSGNVELGLYRNADSGTNSLASTRLQFVWDDRKFYVMLIQITKGKKFIVTLNDDSLVYDDTQNTNVLTDKSGYLGLFSSAGIHVESSWLYISGTPLLIPNATNPSTCMLNVSSPISSIDITTGVPTNEPTSNPIKLSTPSPIRISVTRQSIVTSSQSPTNDRSPNSSGVETTVVVADDTSSSSSNSTSNLFNFDLMQTIVLSMAVWIVVLTVLVCLLMTKNRKLQNRKHSILDTAIQNNIAAEQHNMENGEVDGELHHEDEHGEQQQHANVGGHHDEHEDDDNDVGMHLKVTPMNMTFEPYSRAKQLQSGIDMRSDCGLGTKKMSHKASSDTSFDEIYDKVRSCPMTVASSYQGVGLRAGGGGLFDMQSEGITSISNHTAGAYLHDANFGVMHFLRSRKGTGHSTKHTVSKPPKSSITESVDAMFEDPANLAQNVTLSP